MNGTNMTSDSEAIYIKARELAIEHMQPGLVVHRAILKGAYDKGTMITKWLPEAERLLISNREEAEPEG
jgi:hypothetical protein